MNMRKAVWPALIGFVQFCSLALITARILGAPSLEAQAAGGRFDGNWTTSMACEAHGEMPAYKWDFPIVIKDGNFHGMHSQPQTAGVSENKASGVFALKGNNYDYVIHAKFTDTSGMGILGRTCTFVFTKQSDAAPSSAQ